MIDQSKGFCGYLRRNVERQMIDCLHLPVDIPAQMLLMRIERDMIMSLAGGRFIPSMRCIFGVPPSKDG
jgi:hypothetical protein